ncbi:PKD domain-containing protein [Flavisolibacter sp. BT320]|nr:PKD domain-containing protein [Flavisolibacter longurius]
MTRITVLLIGFFFLLHNVVKAQASTPDFASSTVAGCSPLVVKFTDQSSGAPLSWFWDFGNGATSTLKNPSTTYFTPGQYAVTLKVTYSDGVKTVSRANYITVYKNPEAAFRVSDSVGCYPFPVQFTDASTASTGTANTSWLWDFGDGTQSTQQNPLHTYNYDGTYTVSMKVVNDKGCWSVATKHTFIKVAGGLKADFSLIRPSSCQAPFEAKFTNATAGPGLISYTWDFGDGTTSTEASPIHSYRNAGTYSVTLIAKSSEGCIDTLRKENLLTLGNTVTSFRVADKGCVSDSIRFVNTSSDTTGQSFWDFGDGTTSTEANPVKLYTTTGTFTVRLVQGYGSCADSSSSSLTIFARPKASFTVNKNTYCQVPATVSFSNTVTNAVSYYWDFGDSTTSTQANPIHIYKAAGDYTVTLTVANANGCTDTIRVPKAVSISKPKITIAALPQRGCLPLPVQFTPTVVSNEPVVAYLWRFGNGATSTQQAPSYTYTQQGNYTVTLIVTTASGCTDTLTLKDFISAGTKPKAGFTAVPTTVCASQPVTFTNSSTNSTAWYWDFGEGGSSTEQNPVYLFSDTGTFTIKLIAENHGCQDSISLADYVTIKPPIASFTFDVACTNKYLYSFRDQSIGAKTWQWDFGDGQTSNLQNPTHTYPRYGKFTVILTVTNDSCSQSIQHVVNVGGGIPDFVASTTVACKGTAIHFTADTTNAANIVRYSWNVGAGQPALTGRSVSATYTTAGRYTIVLTTEDQNGCVTTTEKQQYIRINGPAAAFQASNNNGCKVVEASFTDQSKTDGTNRLRAWEWNLGDGTVVNQTTPAVVRHIYDKAGSYDVSLKVRDESGCTDSLLMPQLVNVSDIRASFTAVDTASCPGAAVQFSNNSFTPGAYNSTWNFGNGTTSKDKDPSAVYNAEGLYSVNLTITDEYGCTDSITKKEYISVHQPVASFTVSDSASACIPFPVRYTNTSAYYTSHYWDLNGGTTRLPNPVQYYNNPGVYETKLVVTGPGGCSDTAVKQITLYDVTTTRINYLPLDGCKPLLVDLSTSQQIKMSKIWDMGDGTIIDANDSARQHVYNFFGNFVPKLILRDSSGCVVPISGLDTIRIQGATAKFGLDKNLLCDRGLVNFTDSTTANNPVTAYTWNFGDGTTSSESSPSHYYSQPGNYPVTLSVRTQNNCVDTFRLTAPVRIARSPQISIAGDSVICAGQGVTHFGILQRTDTSLIKWSWRFPNGKEAFAQIPQRQIYSEPGRLVVQAVAVNESGCRDTATQLLVVNPIPTVTLPATVTTTIGTPVLLPAMYSDSVINYKWSEPEGLNCTTCPQPFAKPRFDTRYRVDFEDNNGCRNAGEVNVIVLCNNDNIFVPNTFSPNGDGSNDIFYVRGKGLSRVKTLRIFNRWGQVVFERVNFNVNDPSMGWNGTFKGAKAVSDVYVYQVEIFCDNNQVVKFEGNVALIQ